MGRLLALGILGTLACASLASAQGSITGTVTTAVKGVPPVRVTIDQKVCGDELPDEAIIVDAQGRLANAVVILDEAQNTTSMQMKMFLTRLGENSRMIVTGDPSQVDLPPGLTSGLNEAVRLLANVEGIGHAVFTHDDVVRHELVARIVAAYDKAAAQAPARKGDGRR